MNMNAEKERFPVSVANQSDGTAVYDFETLYQITWLVRPTDLQKEWKYTLCAGSCSSDCRVIRGIENKVVRGGDVASDFVALYSKRDFNVVSLCYRERIGNAYGPPQTFQAPVVDENYIPDGTFGSGRGAAPSSQTQSNSTSSQPDPSSSTPSGAMPLEESR